MLGSQYTADLVQGVSLLSQAVLYALMLTDEVLDDVTVGEGKEQGTLWAVLSSNSARVTSFFCVVVAFAMFPILFIFVAHMGGSGCVRAQGHTETHRGHTLAQCTMHRHWRLLKAEVKSHIKAQSSRSSTVQRRQLPSRERQIVTLIKRF